MVGGGEKDRRGRHKFCRERRDENIWSSGEDTTIMRHEKRVEYRVEYRKVFGERKEKDKGEERTKKRGDAENGGVGVEVEEDEKGKGEEVSKEGRKRVDT